ncbi:hypothetical protein LC613_42740 [Nostoc sphaeroides CHAB 2801]|uniref:hypothetical protein n=1 Tax=Nostoc sphaeroides TaxID=446679 RepID=UPI001E56C965|nr:hypothetical protein [Nostoc sphaeroides]MCC5634121.1 hypothetical protein [Nostoc sphaeroides CHAB 2801]
MVEPKDSSPITKGKIDEAITALKDLKPKERDSLSDREAVRKMRRYIEKLTSDKYGYSYDEVSEMLKGLGINLSGSRIKYLLGELKKSSRRHQKAEPSDNKNPSSNPASENQPTVKASSEAAQTSVKSKKGKSKSQQPAVEEQSAQSNLESELNR